MSPSVLKVIVLPLGFLALGSAAGLLLSPSVTTEDGDKSNSLSRTSVSKRPPGWSNHRLDIASAPASDEYRLAAIMDPLLKGKAPADWNEELQKLFVLLDTNWQKGKFLRLFFVKWAESDFDTAIKEAGKLGIWAISVKREMFKQLAEKDPQKAAAYYEKNAGRLSSYWNLVDTIAENWAKKSREDAWNWCQSLKEDQDKAFTGFMAGLDLNDRELIYKYLGKLTSASQSIPQAFLTQWAGRKPEDAIAWLAQNEPNSAEFKNAVVEGIADKDTKKAGELLATLSAPEKSITVWNISRKILPREGPEAALMWVLEQLPVSAINSLHLDPVSTWSQNAPKEALAWVQKLPDSPMRDEAAALYATNVPNADYYDSAVETVGSIKNESLKKETLERMVKHWQRTNPEKLEKWLQQSPQAKDVSTFLNSSKPQ